MSIQLDDLPRNWRNLLEEIKLNKSTWTKQWFITSSIFHQNVVLESTKWINNGPKTIEQVHLITILVGPSFSISSGLTIKQSNLIKLVYVGYVGNHDPICSPFFLTCAYSGMVTDYEQSSHSPFPTWMCIPRIASVVYDPYTGWWFRTRFIFPYIGNNNPNWLIFFRGVETTNQYNIS